MIYFGYFICLEIILQNVHGCEQGVWFQMEEKGQMSPSCNKVKLAIGIIAVVILLIIAIYARRNLVTGITALIAGVIIGMFLGTKCGMKMCK
jgi:tetrahydromethanopterin S-methyltransferase subunit C